MSLCWSLLQKRRYQIKCARHVSWITCHQLNSLCTCTSYLRCYILSVLYARKRFILPTLTPFIMSSLVIVHVMTALFDFDLFILILTLHLLVWVHKTSLAPPPFIEGPVPSQEGERLCFCVLGGSILPFSTIFYWILQMFRQCGILCFSFYSIHCTLSL